MKKAAASVKVRLYGPNLNDQSKGNIHVHAAGCPECSNYGRRGRLGGESHMAKPWVAASKREVVLFVYEDHIEEGSTYESCRDDMWMDCECLAGLPEEPVQDHSKAYAAAAKLVADRLRKRFGGGWDLLGSAIQVAFVDQEVLMSLLGQAPSADNAGAQQHARNLRTAVLAALDLVEA